MKFHPAHFEVDDTDGGEDSVNSFFGASVDTATAQRRTIDILRSHRRLAKSSSIISSSQPSKICPSSRSGKLIHFSFGWVIQHLKVKVNVFNATGNKLPSSYPDGLEYWEGWQVVNGKVYVGFASTGALHQAQSEQPKIIDSHRRRRETYRVRNGRGRDEDLEIEAQGPIIIMRFGLKSVRIFNLLEVEGLTTTMNCAGNFAGWSGNWSGTAKNTREIAVLLGF